MRQRDVFHFGGFDSPNTTPTPDVLFDQLFSRLTGAELKVLLYIIRRTYGFHKNSDSISLTQITSGIITRDGKVLDRGTGLDRSSAIKATKTLGEKGIIQVRKERSDDGVNLVNIYGLRFRPIPISDQGVVEKTNYGGGEKPLPVVEKNTPQETVLQETVQQDIQHSNFEEAHAREPSEPDGPMAGVLLYTAAPDSEGTLGGLVSQGEPDVLERHILQSLDVAQLCSSDPTCAEHQPGQGNLTLHGAACHTCLFVPETSCERGNRYLERTLLVSTIKRGDLAFFK